jgi:hypothetical protein
MTFQLTISRKLAALSGLALAFVLAVGVTGYFAAGSLIAATQQVLREGVALASEYGTTTKATLAYSLALGGDPSMARAYAAELVERHKTEYISPVDLAVVHMAIGEKEKALDWVEYCIDERRGWAAYLRVHPVVDSLRGEARFNALVKRMAFDAAAAPPVQIIGPARS